MTYRYFGCDYVGGCDGLSGNARRSGDLPPKRYSHVRTAMPALKPVVLEVDQGGTTALLTWSSRGPNPTTHEVQRNGVVLATVAGSVTTYSDTGLVAGTTYAYRIRSIRDFTSVYSNTVTVTVAAASVPTTAPFLSGTAGAAQVSLSWTAVLDVDEYRLERKVGAGSYSLVTTTADLSHIHTGITNGSTYTYRVRGEANSAADVGPWSNEVARTPTATLPVAPTLTGTPGDSENTLDWNSVANATTYRLRHNLVGGTATSFPDTTATDYVDDTAVNGSSYEYSVRGITSDGQLGSLSNTVTLQPTSSVPAPEPGGLFIDPDGLDTNPGTINAPMKTILAASPKLVPGQTLWMRGGTYTGQGGRNWKKSGTTDNPVTLKAYPGELPIINGGGTWSHGIIIEGFSWVVIDGIKITNTGRGSTGDAAIYTVNAHHITIKNCQLVDNGANALLDHQIYIGTGCSYFDILDNTLDDCPGGSVHTYHDPGPHHLTVDGNTCSNAHWGVVLASTGIHTVTISNNIFANNDINIDLRRPTSNVTITGNSPNNNYSGTTPT